MMDDEEEAHLCDWSVENARVRALEEGKPCVC